MSTKEKKQKSLAPLIALNAALAVILIGIVVYLFAGYETLAPPASDIPAFGMKSAFSEDSFTNADLPDEPFILNIFASWCVPCEAEHPVLTELAEAHGLPLYGIALQDTEEDLKKFLDRLGNPYSAIGMDNGGLMISGLGINGVPTTIVADENRKIHFVSQGPVTPNMAEEKILPLMQQLKH